MASKKTADCYHPKETDTRLLPDKGLPFRHLVHQSPHLLWLNTAAAAVVDTIVPTISRCLKSVTVLNEPCHHVKWCHMGRKLIFIHIASLNGGTDYSCFLKKTEMWPPQMSWLWWHESHGLHEVLAKLWVVVIPHKISNQMGLHGSEEYCFSLVRMYSTPMPNSIVRQYTLRLEYIPHTMLHCQFATQQVHCSLSCSSAHIHPSVTAMHLKLGFTNRYSRVFFPSYPQRESGIYEPTLGVWPCFLSREVV